VCVEEQVLKLHVPAYHFERTIVIKFSQPVVAHVRSKGIKHTYVSGQYPNKLSGVPRIPNQSKESVMSPMQLVDLGYTTVLVLESLLTAELG
jgi:hypothetical protein